MESNNNPSYLEVLLKKHHEENNIAKVLSVDVKPATKKGDNYMSEINRVKMEVLLKSGKKIKKALIVKGLPQTEHHQQFLKDMTMFFREINMYRDVIPKMEEVLLEFGDFTEPMWPRLLDYKPNDTLVFNDLNESGYMMENRKEGLDLDQCLLVMRSLAKFHATSIILRDRGIIPGELFDRYVFSGEKIKEKMQGFYSYSLMKLIETMEKEWEPEWKPTIEKLRTNILPKVMELTLDCVAHDEKKFNVLNHGDCWVNNMLFKNGLDSDKPISVKFVDFQMCFYTSPAYDLQYFLSTSLNRNVRLNSIEVLLQAYHKSLVKQLNLYAYKGDIITYDQLLEDLKEKDVFGLTSAMMLLASVFREESDESYPEIEDMLKQEANAEQLAVLYKMSPLYAVAMKDLLNRMIKNNSL